VVRTAVGDGDAPLQWPDPTNTPPRPVVSGGISAVPELAVVVVVESVLLPPPNVWPVLKSALSGAVRLLAFSAHPAAINETVAVTRMTRKLTIWISPRRQSEVMELR
jgi:hypothetical protein